MDIQDGKEDDKQYAPLDMSIQSNRKRKFEEKEGKEEKEEKEPWRIEADSPALDKPAWIWRFNTAHECPYELVDTLDQEFSTLRKGGLPLDEINVGSLIVVVASGDNRADGVLGLYEVKMPPYKSETEELECYLPEKHAKRQKVQHRVRCRQLVHVTTPNLSKIQSTPSIMKLLKSRMPQRITKPQLTTFLNVIYVSGPVKL